MILKVSKTRKRIPREKNRDNDRILEIICFWQKEKEEKEYSEGEGSKAEEHSIPGTKEKAF